MGAPSDFYERLERDTPTLATWSGEMVFTTYVDHCETTVLTHALIILVLWITSWHLHYTCSMQKVQSVLWAAIERCRDIGNICTHCGPRQLWVGWFITSYLVCYTKRSLLGIQRLNWINSGRWFALSSFTMSCQALQSRWFMMTVYRYTFDTPLQSNTC